MGKLRGSITKKILLWYDNAPSESPSQTLTLKVSTPNIIASYPQSLSWKAKEDQQKKTARILVTDANPIEITKVQCSDSNFMHELKTIREGFEYERTVTPKSTSKAQFAAVKLTTNSKSSRYRYVTCFVSVKP